MLARIAVGVWSAGRLQALITSRRLYSQRAVIGRLTLGDVSQEVTAADHPPFVPARYVAQEAGATGLTLSGEALEHLRWMLQKDALRQDIFLIGPPGPARRNLALAFCELTNREVEYIALSRDTTESDLKQRREIRSATAHYVNQAATIAAIQGRVLILEGIEKAENNVLPILNNLLENREMRLENGDFLVNPARYDALLKEHSKEELDQARLIRVSDDFRVIALGLPVPQYRGNSLDPPLRSRFQARNVGFPSYTQQTEALSAAYPAVDRETIEGLASFASTVNHSADEVKLPRFPADSLRAAVSSMAELPQLRPTTALHAVYPHRLLVPKDKREMLHGLLERFALAGSPKSIDVLPAYTVSSVEPPLDGQTFGMAKLMNADGSVSELPVPMGNDAKLGVEPHMFISTPRLDSVLADMVRTHASGDICLVGGRGVGKSALVNKFASLLHYHVEPVFMYADMTGRDLLQHRATLANGDTVWRPSPVVTSALNGHLLVLDGIHHVNPGTITVLQRLAQDRELTLYDGTRLVRRDRYDHIKAQNGYSDADMLAQGVQAIHPAFRIVALAEPPKVVGASSWLTDELLTMFQFHCLDPLSAAEEKHVLSALVPKVAQNQLDRLVDFAHTLRKATDHTVLSLSTSLSTRQLLRICRHVSEFPDEDLYGAIHTACLARFLPAVARETLDKLLAEAGIHNKAGGERFGHHQDDLQIRKVTDGGQAYIEIGDVRARVHELSPEDSVLVPDVVYFDNKLHTEVMAEMMKDFLLGENLLLIGSQGVGKNKIVDRFLHLLNRPREYIQLHRDTTVQSLTLQPTVKSGVIVYEDSPLVLAVTRGRVLVVDEADKAPTHVTGILKSLAENGTMRLSDGRMIVPADMADEARNNPQLIAIHPDFRLVVLANRPGFPFLGHDFFAALGDVFSCHAMDNVDPESELAMLRQYGPAVPEEVLRQLTGLFADLRGMVHEGALNYPYSTRELVNIVRHLQAFPDEGISSCFRNVFDFDAYDTDTRELLMDTLARHGFPLGATDASVTIATEYPLPMPIPMGQWVPDMDRLRKHDVMTLRVNLQGPYSMGHAQQYRTARRESRALRFNEEKYTLAMPIPAKSRAVSLASGDDRSIHVATTNPAAVYTIAPDHRTYTHMDLSDLHFYVGARKDSPHWTVHALGGAKKGMVLAHEGLSNVIAFVDTEKRKLSVGRLGAGAEDASGKNSAWRQLKDKVSPARNTSPFVMVPSTEPNRFLFYQPGSDKLSVFDANANVTYTAAMAMPIANVQPVSSRLWFASTPDSTALMALITPDGGQPSPIPTHTMPVKPDAAGRLQFVGRLDQPLPVSVAANFGIEDPSQLNALDNAATEEAGRVPIRPAIPLVTSRSIAQVLDNPSLLAEGLPVQAFGIDVEGLAPPAHGTYLAEPRQIALLHPDDTEQHGGSSAGGGAVIEVLDLERLTVKSIAVPIGGGDKSPIQAQPGARRDDVMMTRLGQAGLVTVDSSGHVRIFDTAFDTLQSELRTWKYMLGDGRRKDIQLTIERYSGEDVQGPKHGKVDADNTPHVGGNTWAGGTGGRDTAGLGGKGGPYRLDAGHQVHQLSKEEKDAVPDHIKQAAREMGEQAFRERLKEIQMSQYDAELYQKFVGNVATEIHELRRMLQSLEAKQQERQWLKNQTIGDLDDNRLVDGVTGEAAVYKRRGTPPTTPGLIGTKPKRVRFVLDLSGSMYRFNGFDGRLTRVCEIAAMIMESFSNDSTKIKYEIVGHSGDSPEIPLVLEESAPKNEKERLQVIETMQAHAQFCMSGDNTLRGAEMAIQAVTRKDADEFFVILLSDANLDIYGIHPSMLGRILGSDERVTAVALFLGSLGDQAEQCVAVFSVTDLNESLLNERHCLKRGLGAGRGFVCMDTKELPSIMRQIFQSTILKNI